MSDLVPVHSVGTTLAVDEDGQHRARLTVARYARTLPWRERRTACRELLDMLGLQPEHATDTAAVTATDPPR